MAKSVKQSQEMTAIALSLKFVQGSLAKKNIVEINTHFCIKDNTIRAYNGSLAMCAPIPLAIECKPKGAPFVKAIQGCADTVSLGLTAANKLRIKAGAFKALVECTEDPSPEAEPEGTVIDVDGERLYRAVKDLFPYIGNDASRPWTNCLKLEGQYALATNNVILVQYFLGKAFPFPISLHREVCQEIIRIKEPPISAQSDGRSITFHYPDGRWIRGNLVAHEDAAWGKMETILNVPNNATELDPNFFLGLNVVKPFRDGDGRVFFEDGLIKTHLHDEDNGASYEVSGLPEFAAFNLEMLQVLESTVERVDWTMYPKPCIFYGKELRGAIIGIRVK